MDTIALQTWFNILWPKMLVLVALILLDMLGGALVAWKRGIFKWEKLPEGLSVASGYIFSWLAIEIVAFLPTLFALNISSLSEFIAANGPWAVYLGAVLKYLAGLGTSVKVLTDKS